MSLICKFKKIFVFSENIFLKNYLENCFENHFGEKYIDIFVESIGKMEI